MNMRYYSVFVFILLTAVACGGPSVEPPPQPSNILATPAVNIQATIEAAVQSTMEASLESTPTTVAVRAAKASPTPLPTLTPVADLTPRSPLDLKSLIVGALQDIAGDLQSRTPVPVPTPLPTTTASPTATATPRAPKTAAEAYRELGQPTLNVRFRFDHAGHFTDQPDEVVEGSRSILGETFGFRDYSPYLKTDRNTLPLSSGHTYRVTFDYLILETPDRGFETLFYSPEGGRNEDWLPSITLNGKAGDSGSATLINTLLDYTDYEARWNVVGTGAIAVDNVRIMDVTTGQEVASENAENTVPLFADSRPDYLYPPTVDMPDFSKIALDWLGNGFTRIEGRPGAIPGAFPVLVMSPNTASGSLVDAAADGSFSTEIAAPPGSWVIVKYDPTPGRHWLRRGLLDPRDGSPFNIFPGGAQQAPGSWGQVPFGPPSGKGVPFVISAHTRTGYLDILLNGLMTGDMKPGGSVRVEGHITVFPAKEAASSLEGRRLEFWTPLQLLFDAQGRQRLDENQFFSNVITPTGLPVELLSCCQRHLSGGGLKAEPLQLLQSGKLTAPFKSTVNIPRDAPSGLYALGLGTWMPEITSVSLGGARVRQHRLSQSDGWFPPFSVGDHGQSRLNWALLTDVPSADGTRGTVAAEDSSDFQIANRIATQSRDFVIPRVSKLTGEPVKYRLEPYLPMVAQGDRHLPNVPVVSFKLPSGALSVRVTRPDGKVDELGPMPFKALYTRTPATADGLSLDEGGGNLADVIQLSTASPLFEYEFPQYGEYTIEMTGTVDDIYGNTYEGGGTYKVYVAESLDIEPATLPMTPMQVGDVFNPGLTVLPGVPAEVSVKVTLLVDSDPGKKMEYVVTGRANRFGTFTPDEKTPIIEMIDHGEFLVETTARYTDENGVLWMGSTRWGQVVETPGSPVIAHGRRGRDFDENFEALEDVKLWFSDPFPGDGSHVHIPYGRGDIIWQTDDDAGKVKVSLQDTEGLVEAAMREWYAPIENLDFDEFARIDELPLISVTSGGIRPAIVPDDIVVHGYWYGGVQRPGERVREIVAESTANQHGSTYWRFREVYANQPGVGGEGDLPNDFKFVFGGTVFRDTTRDLNRYGIYGSLWVQLPDDDTRGTRVFPPFQGANGGPSGGPIMTLGDEEIDAFVVPLAVRPGTILETGDTFSFSAHLAPTLPGRVDVTVTGPDGFTRTISGRANAIGYFYDPDQDFQIEAPGVYHVSVTATFDSPTSAGPMNPPYPTGTVLGAVDNGFDIYVVPKDSPMMPVPHSEWSVVQGVSAVPLIVEPPVKELSGTVHYTIAMPGFQLESDETPLNGNFAIIEYDPIRLSQTYPNIDVRASRTGRRNQGALGLVDTVWVNALLTGDDGNFYARQFTLQGPDLYALTIE